MLLIFCESAASEPEVSFPTYPSSYIHVYQTAVWKEPFRNGLSVQITARGVRSTKYQVKSNKT